MKNRKKKNAITLLALVITIVIMLLLAGVAIQMTMGENGLIAKSAQAQKAQAKAELYDTAKLSYMSLNTKALENGQPSPNAELVLSTAEFTNKYNVVGDDVTDKKGTVIDTKANVLNIIQGTVAGGFSSGGASTSESWPKTVGGVTIPEEDKDKMILKLKVKSDTEVDFSTHIENLMKIDPIELDYGNGEKENVTDLYNRNNKHYNVGEYILKLKNIKDFGMQENENCEIEILQWGKILEKNEKNIIQISNVSKIYEPEPDRIPIEYINPKFTEIPEGLFKNNVNIVSFDRVFYNCTGITNIPEGLFKNNVNVTNFGSVFTNCIGLTSIPEGIFKNNVNVKSFTGLFAGCSSLISIPEGLFKNNVNVINFVTTFGYSGLRNIPEGLFKNNVNVINFVETFRGCTGLTGIPEDIIELGKKVKERGGDTRSMFRLLYIILKL